jgi:hypothetical protein
MVASSPGETDGWGLAAGLPPSCHLLSSLRRVICVVRVGTIGVAECSPRAPACDRAVSLINGEGAVLRRRTRGGKPI